MKFDTENKIITLTELMTWQEILSVFHQRLINGWRIDSESFLKFCV